jgi:3-hydroxybutyrate dehydrogenase
MYTMDSVLKGKKAVLVGGSSGIGRELALSLMHAGAEVTVFGRHTLEGAISHQLDLDNPENLEIVLASVMDADILCNIRGPFLQKPLVGTTAADWTSIVYENLAFPGMLVSAVLPHMCTAGWGRILLFGGTRTDAVRGFKTNAAYAAAKTGVSSLVKSVALDYASYGVTCNAVCPGLVDSVDMDAEQKRALAEKNPDGTLVSVREIAEAAFFLLASGSCNGVLLPVDKGWSPAFI